MAQKDLSEVERQQLSEQLTAFRVTIDSDFPHAMELLTEMVEEYQGSDFHDELESLSEMMAGFDSDGAVALCRSIQKRLS